MKVKDLYLGAYILCEGGKLAGLEIEPGKGKPTVIFHIEGPESSRIFANYLTGKATVNLTVLRSNLSYLKDRMFDAIRQDSGKGHSSTKVSRSKERREKCDYPKRRSTKSRKSTTW